MRKAKQNCELTRSPIPGVRRGNYSTDSAYCDSISPLSVTPFRNDGRLAGLGAGSQGRKNFKHTPHIVLKPCDKARVRARARSDIDATALTGKRFIRPEALAHIARSLAPGPPSRPIPDLLRALNDDTQTAQAAAKHLELGGGREPSHHGSLLHLGPEG